MRRAITPLLAAAVALFGCYKPLHSKPLSDASRDTLAVDSATTTNTDLADALGVRDGGDVGAGSDGSVDGGMAGSGGTSGTGGIAFDANITGAGGTLGSGGAGIDVPVASGGSGSGGSGTDAPAVLGGAGVDAPISTGGLGSGGAPGSGGTGPDTPVTCGSGTHNCNGTCVSNYALETCGSTECTTACKKPTGGSVSCDGTVCVPSCPASAPQNCDGTCIGENAPCGGKCPGSQRYCSNSNTCISAAGCCSSADCPAGGTNTVPSCSNNVCGLTCSSPSYTMCGNSCSDLGSDPNNCHACGSKCGTSTPKCLSATCVECVSNPDCAGNKICSGNQCVCPNNDGACGSSCTPCSGSTPRCSAGSCVQCITTGDCSDNQICTSSQCKAPLACGDPLPAVAFPQVFVVSGSPPLPTGGTITEGSYALTKVTCYSAAYSTVPGDSFQLQNGAFHHRHTTYSTTGSAMSGYEELGTYSASGPTMTLNITKCGTTLSAQSQWTYTATSNQIQTFTGSGEDTCIQTFAWQP